MFVEHNISDNLFGYIINYVRGRVVCRQELRMSLYMHMNGMQCFVG